MSAPAKNSRCSRTSAIRPHLDHAQEGAQDHRTTTEERMALRGGCVAILGAVENGHSISDDPGRWLFDSEGVDEKQLVATTICFRDLVGIVSCAREVWSRGQS